MSGTAWGMLALSLRLQDWVLLLGVSLITAGLMMRQIRRRRSGAGKSLTPAEHLERVRQEKGVRADLEDLMVEIEQMAKRVGAQLDAKAVHLEKMVAEADRRIAELKRLQGREGESPASRGDDAGPRVDGPAPRGNGAAGFPDLRGSPGKGPDAGPGQDALSKAVYTLADQGLSALDIARRVGQDVGKVELILALRQA